MTLRNLAVERIRLRQDAFEGRVAVVTGGGQGIGREIVRAFAALGASVAIAEMSDEGIDTERVVRESGDVALFVRTDVSSEADVARLAQKAEQAFGPVDILVNSAALSPVASLLQIDVALWDRVMAVNLRGAFLTCKAFLPGMLARRRGTIVNVLWKEVMPSLSACAAANQGLAGLTAALAAEIEDGVHVIAFDPGLAYTPGLRGIAQGLALQLGLATDEFLKTAIDQAYQALTPPDHAAAAIAYLVAALADNHHGQTVTGQTVLESAGFSEPSMATAEIGMPVAAPAPEPGLDHSPAVRHVVALSERLQQIIGETDAELDRLPAFVRPIARRAFEAKAGQSIHDWTGVAAHLTTLLKGVGTSSGKAEAALEASYPFFEDSLSTLIRCYEELPAEMASLIGSGAAAQGLRHLAAQWQTSLHFLLTELKRMHMRLAPLSPRSGREGC